MGVNSMTMTSEEIKKFFPNASASCIRANSAPDTSPKVPSAEPQHPVRDEPVAAPKRKKVRTPGALQRVAITCYRCRLQDPDNCCVKYIVDGLRHEKIIPDDSPDHIILEVRQVKVAHRAQEGTVVEVWPKK